MTWKFPEYEVGESLDWNKMEIRYDWFGDMHDVMQDPIWHAEGDVYVHTKMVVEELLEIPEYRRLPEQGKHILLAAAMFHDVEKRSCTTRQDMDGVSRIVSPRHAKKGEYTAREILYKEMNTPFEIREQIAKLVRLHGLPLWAIDKPNPTKAVIEASLVVNTHYLSILAKADILGRICDDQENILLKIELFNELCKENDCFAKEKKFSSNYARYIYLNKSKSSPEYEPYDDLKFDVYVMCALPGTGKDFFIKENYDLPVLSLDSIRNEEGIRPADKKKKGKLIQIAKEKAKEFLRAEQSFVFNATNITTDIRAIWCSLFTDYGARVKISYLEVPYETLLEQNFNRDDKVPEKVIDAMISKWEIPSFKEAYDVDYIVK
ncbi:MAG: AAA family ATPase [Lentisphaeria bacterium]|nr:AAA family ATPase [Lentisphaeria bacterium]